MAWETRRNGRRYYYRARRIGGRVVKEYVGAGLGADLAAAEEAAKVRQAAKRAEERRADRHRLAAADDVLAALDAITDTLTRATLTAAGYHQHHRGAWRKRRE
jgi:hypothetical protein